MLNVDLILDNIWLYLGFPALVFLGLYFSLASKFFQIRKLPKIYQTFSSYLNADVAATQGYHPLKMFFAAIGGCIGIGNVVGVCTAVKIGGPGAILWIWITAIIGSVVKYAEIFLGMKYRKLAGDSYVGGPFYYLQSAFSGKKIGKILAYAAATLLCIYGVEVYVFSTIVSTIDLNWHLPHTATVIVLLGLVLFGVYGGMERIGKISAAIVPLFIVVFFVLCFWVIGKHYQALPAIFADILHSAFHGHAALGGFVGSTAMMAITQGISWACYSGDIGIGYASVIHSKSSESVPARQASLAILGVVLDTFVICTLSLVVIMASGVWHTNLPVALYIQTSLAEVVPFMHIFMPILFGILGYSTIIAYFGVGLQNAELLLGQIGRKLYLVYGIVSLTVFAYFSPDTAALLMRVAGVCLLIINVIGFYRLRKSVEFGV